MRTFLFFFLTLTMSLNLLNAQEWFLYKEFPLNAVPKDIDVNNEGTLFMLTTDFNYYYKPLGGEWVKMNQPLLSNGTSILADKSSNRLYVGTGYLGIYHTSDYGENWGSTYLTTSPVSGHHEGYICFAGTGNPNLFFAGPISFSPQITRFTNQGTSGEFRTIDPSMNSNSAAQSMYYTANQKLLVGTVNNGIWISENNANSFIQTGFNSGNVLKFTEDNNGRVYALAKNLSDNSFLIITSDDYMNWTTLGLPDEDETYTTIFYDTLTSSLWLGSNQGVYKTGTDIISWENQTLNGPDPNAVELIYDNHSSLYLFTIGEGAKKLNADHTAWEQKNEGLEGEISQISINNNKLFAYHNFFSNRISEISNPGDNWVYTDLDMQNTASGIKNFSIDPENEILTTTFNKIYHSADNGETYTEVGNPTDSFLGIAKNGSGNNLFVTDYSGNKLYKSTDNGQNWTVVFDGGSVFSFSVIIDFIQNETGELYLVLFNSSNGFLYHLYGSVDDGETWDLLYENDSFLNDITLEGKFLSFGENNYFVSDYNVLKINMNPQEPVQISLPIPQSNHVPILSFKRATTGELFINYYTDQFYKSTDNGNSWEGFGHPVSNTSANPDPIGSEIELSDIPFWIMPTENQWNVPPGIYYYLKDSLKTSEASINTVDIYPNPVSGEFYINTDYRGALYLFDVSGKLITENTVNQKITKINIQSLPKGIYFLKLENGQSYKVLKQ